MNDDAKITDSIARSYMDVMKYILIIISSLFLVLSILFMLFAITLPKHPEFNPTAAARKTSTPQETPMNDTQLESDILLGIDCPVDKAGYINIDYNLEGMREKLKIAGDKNYMRNSYCFQQIAKKYGVPTWRLGDWYKFHTALMDGYHTTYLYANAIYYSSVKFTDALNKNKTAQKDFYFDSYTGLFSLAFFTLSILLWILLIMIKIENNTKKSDI